jgi:hypothetical protein
MALFRSEAKKTSFTLTESSFFKARRTPPAQSNQPAMLVSPTQGKASDIK